MVVPEVRQCLGDEVDSPIQRLPIDELVAGVHPTADRAEPVDHWNGRRVGRRVRKRDAATVRFELKEIPRSARRAFSRDQKSLRGAVHGSSGRGPPTRYRFRRTDAGLPSRCRHRIPSPVIIRSLWHAVPAEVPPTTAPRSNAVPTARPTSVSTRAFVIRVWSPPENQNPPFREVM